ncbi:NADP-dependent oxidoreductase domain-containing protein [Rhizoctonia solani]|nr:NADP-dependent oxidoreductase domain-containing protein [Rhizoctonia solani]
MSTQATAPTKKMAYEEGIKHIKAAYDLGIQTFDTANIYSNGLSEVVLGKAIKKYNFPRDEIVVMTKVFGTVAPTMNVAWANAADYPNQNGLSRKHVFEAVKHSLERLQLDYVDVLQCHRFDPDTPIEETMQALHDVFHVMQNYAITHNLTPFISMQNHHSLVYREEEREMFPTLKHFGVGIIPWSPLARGYLTRPVNDEGSKRNTTDPASRKPPHSCKELAKKYGVTMAQIATAWSLSKVTAPIVGTTSLKNLEELAAAVHIELEEDDIKALEEPYGPQAIHGHM